jgi:hypothetical protein
MASIIKVDTIQDQDGNNIINESSDTITIGASGDTITIPSGATTTLTDGVSGDFKMNSGFGSVTTVYGCRAWVNFDGTGTLAIRDSGNVSSVTDNGTGSYTPNFSTNMPDVNFTAITNAGPVISTPAKQFNFCSCNAPAAVGSINITNRSVDIDDAGFASADNAYVGLIVIR